jgi:hypothetical protein
MAATRTADEIHAFEEAKQHIRQFILNCVKASRKDDIWCNSVIQFRVRNARRYLNIISDPLTGTIQPLNGWSLDLSQIEVAKSARRKGFALEFIRYILSIMKQDFLYVESVLTEKMNALIVDNLEEFAARRVAYGSTSWVLASSRNQVV